MSFQSYADANAARLQAFLLTVFCPERGTNWWVEDDLWSRRLPHFSPRENNRHPGLSIAPTRLPEHTSSCPMLLGSTRRRGPIQIKGLNENDPEKIGFFGHLLTPARITAADFAGRGTEGSSQVLRNRQKPEISAEEMKELNQFLAKHDLDIES